MKEKILKAVSLMYYVAMGAIGIGLAYYVMTKYSVQVDTSYWEPFNLPF